jgi:hypothetical protein
VKIYEQYIPGLRYQKAIDAKKERSTKSSQNFGAKGTRGGLPNQVK